MGPVRDSGEIQEQMRHYFPGTPRLIVSGLKLTFLPSQQAAVIIHAKSGDRKLNADEHGEVILPPRCGLVGTGSGDFLVRHPGSGGNFFAPEPGRMTNVGNPLNAATEAIGFTGTEKDVTDCANQIGRSPWRLCSVCSRRAKAMFSRQNPITHIGPQLKQDKPNHGDKYRQCLQEP